MRVRAATCADAPAACDVLRRSIVELCHADHRGDAAVLTAWLANKSVDTVAAWIADAGRHVVVAMDQSGVIVGVGMAGPGGTIELNYVSPDARFRGVSKAVVRALEAWVTSQGHARCTLVSTATARRRDGSTRHSATATTARPARPSASPPRSRWQGICRERGASGIGRSLRQRPTLSAGTCRRYSRQGSRGRSMSRIRLPHPTDHRLSQACRRYRVERLDLFGSAAGKRFDPARSDLDFLVQFAPLEPAAYADAYFGLRETLSELFDRPIDLVTDAALANPFFKERVLAERKSLYVAS